MTEKTHLRGQTPGVATTKDWILEIHDDHLLISYGVTGKKLKSIRIPESQCARGLVQEAQDRIDAKLREGYRDVGTTTAGAGPQTPPPPVNDDPKLYLEVRDGREADTDRIAEMAETLSASPLVDSVTAAWAKNDVEFSVVFQQGEDQRVVVLPVGRKHPHGRGGFETKTADAAVALFFVALAKAFPVSMRLTDDEETLFRGEGLENLVHTLCDGEDSRIAVAIALGILRQPLKDIEIRQPVTGWFF